MKDLHQTEVILYDAEHGLKILKTPTQYKLEKLTLLTTFQLKTEVKSLDTQYKKRDKFYRW